MTSRVIDPPSDRRQDRGNGAARPAAARPTGEKTVTAYALAHLRPGTLNEQVLEYIERIQSTMDPFGGRFLVHGKEVEVLEGPFPGTLVMIGFPDLERARAWYASPAYQQILPLRADHVPGEVVLAEGVPADYDATATATALRTAAGL